jgi:CPA2 family monovalent cation:H+ antiporter-2
MALGQQPVAALAIGAALTLSSTAIAVPVLVERKRLHAEGGRATFSVLLFQDLAVAPILITLAILGRGDGTFGLKRPAGPGAGGDRPGGDRAVRPPGPAADDALGGQGQERRDVHGRLPAGDHRRGLVASLSGLSMALGAFVAGILLAETEYRHEVEVKIEPFKGLLLSLFFVSLGIRLDLSLLVASPVFVLGVAVGLLVVKGVMIMGLGRLFGLSNRGVDRGRPDPGGRRRVRLRDPGQRHGRQRGLRPGRPGRAGGRHPDHVPDPAAVGDRRAAGQARRGPGQRGPRPGGPAERGAGGPGAGGRLRPGRPAGRRHAGPPRPALDRHRPRPQLRPAGPPRRPPVYFGDASRVELLERCGLDHARAVVVTMDSPEAAEAVVATARAIAPT